MENDTITGVCTKSMTNPGIGGSLRMPPETLETARHRLKCAVQAVQHAHKTMIDNPGQDTVQDACMEIRDAWDDMWAYAPEIVDLEPEFAKHLHSLVSDCIRSAEALASPTQYTNHCVNSMADKEKLIRLLVFERDLPRIREILDTEIGDTRGS